MSTPKQHLETLGDAASAWAVRHAAGLNAAARVEFEHWLAADPRNYAAFAEADLALTVLSFPRGKREREELRAEMAAWEARRRARRTHRRRLAFSAAGLAAAAMLVVALVRGDWLRATDPLPDTTMTLRPLAQSLPDGSVIELTTSADVRVEFTDAVRGVRLIRGEAHFVVAKDPRRPFIVSVGPVKVHAIGTEFNVRVEPDAVEVLITEGRVRLIEEARSTRTQGSAAGVPEARETDLVAGHRTVVPLTAEAAPPALVVSAVSAEDIQRVLAWRRMRFELSNATLEHAVALWNQKGGTRFVIGDSELRSRRISGNYWADKPEQFAELIASSLEVKAIREAPDRIVFRKP